LNTIVLQQFLCGWQREKDQGSWFPWVDVCGCVWCRYWTHFVRWAPQDRSHWASGKCFHKGSCRAGYAKSLCCAHDDFRRHHLVDAPGVDALRSFQRQLMPSVPKSTWQLMFW
jgi:hypothetical protein